LATFTNYYPVCCEAVRSAILCTTQSIQLSLRQYFCFRPLFTSRVSLSNVLVFINMHDDDDDDDDVMFLHECLLNHTS